MTTTSPTTFRAFVREPFDLALGQPHQMLISTASVTIVAMEAATLIPWPANIALAVGAEWAYLRGLISGAGIKSRWAGALNISAVVLVVLYGALWGFRSFHLIPETPPAGVAVLLTIIHIGAISAVTLCSAMLHRAGEDARAEEQREAAKREDARQQRMQDEAAALELEMKRKEHELALFQQAEAARVARELEIERARAEIKMQSANARMKMRRDAHPERTNAEPQICPKCRAELDRARWLAARRWGYCAACKNGVS